MKRRFILSVLSCFFIFALHSQDSNLMEELRLAGAISDTGLRLFTYDAILESYGLREKRKENDVGKWQTSTQIDPIDDSQIIYFSLTADSGVSVYGGMIKIESTGVGRLVYPVGRVPTEEG